jgi:hypothetical protein
LYYLLAGHAPFKGNSLPEIWQAHQSRTAQPLDEVRSEVPAELAAVVAKMMAKITGERYQTPVEVAKALAPFARGGGKTRGTGAAPAVKSASAGTVIAGETSRVVAQSDKAARRPAGKPEAEPSPFADLEAAPAPTPSDKRENKRRAAAGPARAAWRKRPAVLVKTGIAALALILLAGIIVKVKLALTDGDTGKAAASLGDTGKPRQPPQEALVLLEIDQPDAEVLVDGGKILLTIPGDKKPVEIRLAPGKPHTLEVKRDGFATYTQGDVELKAGESKPIKVSLQRLAPAAPRLFPIAKDVEQAVFGAWQIENGELGQRQWAWGSRILFGDKTWTDYDFTVDAQMTDRDCGFGLMVRNSGLKPHVHPQDGTIRHKDLLIFVVGGYANTHHYVEQIIDEKGQELARKGLGPDQRLKMGEWYTARASVRGNRLQCYLKSGNQQEEKLFDLFPDAPPAGLVGLMAWDAPFKFRNIKVTDPSGKVLLEGLPDFDDRGAKPQADRKPGPSPVEGLKPRLKRNGAARGMASN